MDTSTKPAQIFPTVDQSSQSEKTTDGFQNFVARLGVSNRGEQGGEANLLSHGHYQFNLVTRNRIALEAAYRGSWIVGRVIDTVAKDMTRAGIDIQTNEGAEDVQEIKVQMSRFKIWQSIASTIKWARLYGGAVAVLQIQGQDPKTPIDLDTVGKGQFLGLVVYDRWQIYPDLSEMIQTGPDMGLPKYYNLITGSNLSDPNFEPGVGPTNSQTGQVKVHHSRLIRMVGIELPFFQAITEMMWGESVLERMWDRLIGFDDATLATANLINRAQLRTVGIDGLREILSAGGAAQKALIEQFEYMRQLQSNEGITLLDKEDTFASTAYSFAGISDVIIQMGQQVSGAAEIPLVALFGQSPAGLSATGDADIRLYYDGIKANQEANLRNPFEILLKVLWRSVTGKEAPKDMTFTFTPLWQMSATDQATVAKTNTDTIIEAHDAGAIDTATMMKELKQNSAETGLFTHITDEQIEEAEQEEPPMPEPGEENGSGGAGEEKNPSPEVKPKPDSEAIDPEKKSEAAESDDSLFKKIKDFFGSK